MDKLKTVFVLLLFLCVFFGLFSRMNQSNILLRNKFLRKFNIYICTHFQVKGDLAYPLANEFNNSHYELCHLGQGISSLQDLSSVKCNKYLSQGCYKEEIEQWN